MNCDDVHNLSSCRFLVQYNYTRCKYEIDITNMDFRNIVAAQRLPINLNLRLRCWLILLFMRRVLEVHFYEVIKKLRIRVRNF